jgi:hypothetical protein
MRKDIRIKRVIRRLSEQEIWSVKYEMYVEI